MTVDHDGVIRMDCSSPYAMARLVKLKDKYRVAFANRSGFRPAWNRHAVGRADDPNHYLAVAIRYLLAHRPLWARTFPSAKRW